MIICVLGIRLAAPVFAQTPDDNDPVPAQPLATSPATPEFHVVLPGESLSVIAQRYGLSLAALMAENGITDPDAIRIGARLRLPPLAQTSPTPAGPGIVGVDPQFALDDAPALHVVLPGESVLGIAQRYGISAAELMAWNGITDPDHIVIGRSLRLTAVPETDRAQPEAPAADALEADAIEEEPAEEEPVNEISADEEPGDPRALTSTLNRRIRVASGDTIGGLALRHGVNEEALRLLNGLGSSGLTGNAGLVADMELILPATRAELRPEPVPQAAAMDDRLLHTVVPGDSLGAIAQRYGRTLADLLAANRITDPNAIRIGQQLTIPDPEAAPEDADAAMPVQVGRPQRGFFFYTVQQGDTLSELAREFNTTYLAILDYNNLTDPEMVFRDVALRIPFGPPPAPVAAPPSPQSGTRFMVSLSRQQCWVLQGERVLYEWVCSTGYGEWITRTGVFAVQTKLEMAQSNYYELDMPYWLGIYDVGAAENGIHGLPVEWETGAKIWEGLLGQPATFGCAMLADDDAATLFDLAYLGMPVYIVN
ncbi:MAG: LysM peptidoglycan-binding domain-containing protein [Litorilinea sp.]